LRRIHTSIGALFHGIFHTFPEKQSVNFSDLYMRHPTKPNLWAFKVGSNDLVVLSNGYKISPLEILKVGGTYTSRHILVGDVVMHIQHTLWVTSLVIHDMSDSHSSN
jgi:hypothetical protein